MDFPKTLENHAQTVQTPPEMPHLGPYHHRALQPTNPAHTGLSLFLDFKLLQLALGPRRF